MAQTENIYADSPGVAAQVVERGTTLMRTLGLHLLTEPLNPMRHNMDDAAMLELMDGIRHSGLLQNLGVVPILGKERVTIPFITHKELDAHEARGGRYRVAFGHRRLLACRAINYAAILCKVFCDLEQTEAEIMSAENVHREEPTDYDLAVMYGEWCKEPGMTEAALCKRAGKSPEFIYARTDLLAGYKEVSDALHARKIKFSVAKALNTVEEPEFMLLWLHMAIEQGATSKLVKAWIGERKCLKDMTPPTGPASAPHISIQAPVLNKIECLICGETQSYNLRTVLMCADDIEQIRELRATREKAEAEGNE